MVEKAKAKSTEKVHVAWRKVSNPKGIANLVSELQEKQSAERETMTNEEAARIIDTWIQNAIVNQEPDNTKSKIKKALNISPEEAGAFGMAICALYNIEQRPEWIPVTDHYPDVEGDYFVTEERHVFGITRRVAVMRSFRDGEFGAGNQAIAWLSNLKPYQGDV